MSKKALVLGTGLVSKPCVEMLLKHGFVITCVSFIQKELDNLHTVFPSVATVMLDVSKEKERLKTLIKETYIVICLLPSFFQFEVAMLCIEEKKNLVTTSYVDEATKSLHERAVAAGITVLTEAGLDPGIDHMIAMKCVDALKGAGGQISELKSICGGIPAEENRAGCMKYKFSWYPKGVFISALQPAKYLLNGQVVESHNAYENAEKVTGTLEHLNLECLPNRDSLKYTDTYGIQTVTSLFRGTLRYQGFSKILKSLALIGLMEQSALPELANDSPDLTWKELLIILLRIPADSTQVDVEKALMKRLENDTDQLKIINELRLVSDDHVPKKITPLDSLCTHLVELLAYNSDEQDLVIMFMKVSAKLPSGKPRSYEVLLSEKGFPIGGQSAMSRTVGITAATCTELLATGLVQRKGVILPITKDIYEPALALLCEEGIKIKLTITDS